MNIETLKNIIIELGGEVENSKNNKFITIKTTNRVIILDKKTLEIVETFEKENNFSNIPILPNIPKKLEDYPKQIWTTPGDITNPFSPICMCYSST